MNYILRFLALPSAALAFASSSSFASTYSVTSLADSTNSGTLRWAIKSANDAPLSGGVRTITFATNGTINLSSPLPVLYKPSTLDGTTAPGYISNPVVSVNFQGNPGLIVAATAKGSSISGLSLVRASGAALTLQGSGIQVSGNFIGLANDGSLAGNSGDGILLTPTSSKNIIGGISPVTSISYTNATNPAQFPITVFAWQGLRANGTNVGSYLISGTGISNNGIIYVGQITGGGTNYSLVGPTNWTQISPYGPDSLTNNRLRVVGSCKITNSTNFNSGFVWEGTTNDLGTNISTVSGGVFRLISHPGAFAQYTHSAMGDLAVGNYVTNLAVNAGEGAYICKLTNPSLTNASAFVEIPKKPLGAKSITAYGIWDNGVLLNTNNQVISHPYTICGGYSPNAVNNITNENVPLTQGQGYLVDYDAVSGKFSNWTSLGYPQGKNIIVHFEGISGVGTGVYQLAADAFEVGSSTGAQGCWVSVNRNPNGSFAQGSWSKLLYPGISNNLTSANSVSGNQVVGLVLGSSSFPFQATINTGFQRANVISGNGGNGISLNGSSSNTISQNYIGTDANGSTNAAYGNSRNGIQLSGGSSFNMIGGQFIDSNNPTGSAGSTTPAFQRPPLGNLISANHLNGVLIENGSQNNSLSGNYIGVDGSGTNVLGNWFNGVDIENSSGNGILGCAFYQNPFAYYNVISGNYGHGVQVNNANNTTFQGNYVGIDALDTTNVSNGGDGLLVAGSSKYVQIGGVIPLGSVISGNRGNGTEITGTVSYATNFNTFGGVPSFKTYAVPNYGDGILITSTGGHNTVRTCVMSGNLGNGVEISGNATGVLIEDTTAGTTTGIDEPLPNQCNGIVISGSAHGNTIGGYNPSIEMSVHASGNVGYGIAVLDSAYSNSIVNTRVGVGLAPTEQQGILPPIPNQQGGVFLEQGTYATTIGGAKPIQANYINNNGGDGLTINASGKNRITGNIIMANDMGIYAWGNCAGTVLLNNFVYGNTNNPQVNVSGATGIIIK
jgi:parallel beta-helix repeat protein